MLQDPLTRSIRAAMPAEAVLTPPIAEPGPPDERQPPAASDALPSPAPDAPVPSPRRPIWRRLRLLKRPAEFLRGFLQAPLHQRLNGVDAALRDVLARQGQTDAILHELLRLMQHEAATRRQQDDAAAERQGLLMDRLNERGAVLAQGLAGVREFLEGERTHRLQSDGSRDGWRQTLTSRLDRLEKTLAVVQARSDLVAGAIGPRFDELEVKARPMVDYDHTSIAVRLGDGYVVAPRADPMVVTMLADAGSGGFEPGTRRVLQALTRPGMCVVDVGANIGVLTLAAARATGPSGRVHAFEADPEVRIHLAKTLAQNGIAWAELHTEALGRQAGSATFHRSRILGHSSLYPLPDDEADRAFEVQVRTLDEALGPVAVDVVKIDVEGAELDVLAGMAGVLARSPDIALIVEYGPVHLVRVGVSSAEWFARFKALGLTGYAIEEPTGRCYKLDQDARRRIERAESTNLVFLRSRSAARARLPQ